MSFVENDGVFEAVCREDGKYGYNPYLYVEGDDAAEFGAKIEVIMPVAFEAIEGEDSYALGDVDDETTYFCVVTWEDGYSLTSDSFIAEPAVSKPSYGGCLMLLVFTRKIRFVDGDTVVHSVRTLKDKPISEYVPAAKDGQVFDGWYMDAELTEKVQFPVNLSGDMSVYAKWISEEAAEAETEAETETETETETEAETETETETEAETETETETEAE